MTSIQPTWLELHQAWWDEQREPEPWDLELAWAALWEVMPNGWTVAKSPYDVSARLWKLSAVLVTGTSRIGHMPQVVSAAGPTEPTAIVELARCLAVTLEGGVPR